MQLAGNTALITGGASGLGEASARRFVDQGARVALLDLNDERGNALAKELGEAALYVATDVTDEQSVAAGITAVLEKFGHIHFCLNFAGIAGAAKTVGKNGPYPLADFKKVIDVNLIGSFNVLRLAAAEMINNDLAVDSDCRGVIINTASVAAFEGQMGQAAYSASKGGIVSMTLPIARDLAAHAIRVNTIAPGLIHTPMFESFPEHVYDALAASVLNPQRLGKADEVAKTAQFIVENDYVNGETLRVDGGIRMQAR